jgi:hypothetical protein
MRKNRMRKVACLVALTWAGTLGLFGCTTATAFREFSQSTLIRVFWQTVGTALQSAIVEQFGAQDQG